MPFETQEWGEDIAIAYLNDSEFDELLGRVRQGDNPELLRAIVELRHFRIVASELVSLVEAKEPRANDKVSGLARALIRREGRRA